MTFEIRTADLWPDVDYELRAASDGYTFDGYAAVFNSPSVSMHFPGIGGGRSFREVIQPGAFAESLNTNPDVVLIWNHDMMGLPFARTSAGTMHLTEDARGLRVQATLPENTHGSVIRDAIARGDIRGMSFRFGNAKDEWSQDGRTRVRTLRQVDLGPEVSFAAWPAYLGTTAAVRAFAEAIEVDVDEAIAILESTKDLSADAQARVKAALNNSGHAVMAVADITTLRQKREQLDKLRPA